MDRDVNRPAAEIRNSRIYSGPAGRMYVLDTDLTIADFYELAAQLAEHEGVDDPDLLDLIAGDVIKSARELHMRRSFRPGDEGMGR